MSTREYGARTRRPANAAHERGLRDPALDPGGPAGVAVVEPHDVEALPGQLPAQLCVPPGHRPAQPHHQQQRLAVGVPKVW